PAFWPDWTIVGQDQPLQHSRGGSFFVWFYLNGRFVEDEDAKVSVTDHSFLYGDGCFEGIGVCEGRIMHLDEHVTRLFKSARMLRMEVPVTQNALADLILEAAS